MKQTSLSLLATALTSATAGGLTVLADGPMSAGTEVHDLNGSSLDSSAPASGSASSSLNSNGSAAGSSSLVTWQTSTSATADPGLLHASSGAHVNNTGTGFSGRDYVFSYAGDSATFDLSSGINDPGAYAIGHWNGIVFSAPAGSGDTTVSATFHLRMSGLLTTSAVNFGGPNLGISASAAVDVSAFLSTAYSVPGTSFGGGANGVMRISQGGGAPSTESSGLLVGAVFDGATANDLVLGPFLFPVGQPVTLDLKLKTAARASSYGFYQVDAVSDFSHTLGLPTGSPVFDLPSGFSVDSSELGILDDRFVVVPEPRDFAFVAGICCAGLVLWRRRGDK